MNDIPMMANPSLEDSAASQSSSRRIKRNRVVGFLDLHELDGILLTLQNSFAWYTDGGRGYVNMATEESIAAVLITRLEDHLFVNKTENVRLAREEFQWNFQHEHLYPWWDEVIQEHEVEKVSGKRVETDAGPLKQAFAMLRYSLLPHEIERYKKLGQEVAGALHEIAPLVRFGMSELDLAAELSYRLIRNDIQPVVLLVAFDERINLHRHPLPTWNKLKSIAMVSVCGRRSGLVASATRLLSLGTVPEDLRARHLAVARVDAWLMRQTSPRSRVADLFERLKQQYAEVGHPNEWVLHHQGGATGYAVRDYRARPSSTEVIQQNQAFAWNPTIAGTKSEDTIIVTDKGFDVLTVDPRWPTVRIEIDGQVVQRPDIFVLD